MDCIYFKDINEVIAIHQKTIEVSGGGADGIINLNSLDCALEQIQNDMYYPEFEDKLTHLFWVANKSHGFQDGNKRIAITICGMFLFKNGFMGVVKDFMFKMESISYHVAAGNIEKELLHEVITSILYEEDYSEPLKLKLMEAFSKNLIDDEEY
ncbi:MAG: type II toxin-antitoxin system death-on-curing family toxin [Bacteroidota bacterium]|nr:type II toxin-antitoxin system death-on-curing family toxin [Bacteroidota bacterium]